MAEACHDRTLLLTAGTKLGLPELQLGILPGFGGTQRLPRLVGLQTAAQMMLTSAPISDKKAAKLGLVDAVVPQGKLLEAARAWAAEIAAGTKPRNFSLYRYISSWHVREMLCQHRTVLAQCCSFPTTLCMLFTVKLTSCARSALGQPSII